MYCKVLNKVQSNSAGGPDKISARFNCLFSVELATPLAHIINSSFQQGTVPREWKWAIVVPVPKCSPPTIDKLWPISLTSHFAKIAEGFIAKRLPVLQDISPKLDLNHFGNRRGLLTGLYLINILRSIYWNAHKPKSTATIILTDITKAFDRIDRTIAIKNLIDLGIHPALIGWIADFFLPVASNV